MSGFTGKFFIAAIVSILIFNTSNAQFSQITSYQHNEYHPKWDPTNNNLIYYTLNTSSAIDLFVYNRANNENTMLPINLNGSFHFDFIHNSSKIIFDGFVNTGPYNLYKFDLESNTVEPFKTNAGYPSVSPDGEKVVYAGPNSNLYISDIDGSNVRNLTNYQTAYEVSDWSPDGNRIAITSERSGNSDIWIINADGSGLTQLTTHPGRDYWPCWSPDGSRIAYTSVDNGNFDIWLIDVNTKTRERLTSFAGVDNHPDWSPDGNSILFASYRGGTQDIWIKSLTTTGIGEAQKLSDSYRLKQNYPNPFNPTTQIEYSIPRQEFVTIKIFDSLGREILKLVNEEREAGGHKIEFDAGSLTAGIYFCWLRAGSFTSSRKMILLK